MNIVTSPSVRDSAATLTRGTREPGTRTLAALRRAADRALHPARRRAATRALRRRAMPRDILVLCYGNVCRSPFAAAVLTRELAPLGVQVRSAGLLAPGRPSPETAIAAAGRRAIDLSAHRAALVSVESARAADLIVVMDELQRRLVREFFGRSAGSVLLLGDLDPGSIDVRAIHDPVGQSPETFDAVYARIERCAGALTSALTAGSGTR